MFFSLAFVREVSRGIAWKEHQTLRLYTLDILTELKKASVDCDRPGAGLLGQTAPHQLAVPSDFVFTRLCWRNRSLLLRPLQDFEGRLPGWEVPCSPHVPT